MPTRHFCPAFAANSPRASYDPNAFRDSRFRIQIQSPLAYLLATAASLCPQTTELVRKGEHFRLVCHFEDKAVADQALAAVEATWPKADELWGLAKGERPELLDVHLYRTAADYETAEQGLTQGAFKRNLAFAHHDTLSAHVAMQPPMSSAALAKLGVPSQTLRLLAHEAAHLLRYTHTQNFRSHPGWLADGSASWIDEQVSSDLGLLRSIEEDPNFATNLTRLQRLLEEKRLPTIEDILRDNTEELEFHERYNLRWFFFRFMLGCREGAKFRQLIGGVRSMGGGPSFTKRLSEQSRQLLGEKTLAKLDREFRKLIEQQSPQWQETYRSLYRTDRGWAQAAFGQNALAWRRSPAGKKTYKIQGELTILRGPNQQMNLLLGRSDQGFFSVAFTAGFGVTLFEFISKTNAWENRGSVKTKDVQVDQTFKFTVTVKKSTTKRSTVKVAINRKPVLAGKAQTLPLDGPWGLGAQSKTAGIWKIRSAPGPRLR